MAAFPSRNVPTDSADEAKKELVGNFKQQGQVWCREPLEVSSYDFADEAECVATPYGVYDLARNRGFVSVGLSHNTPEFAVHTIMMWWRDEGQHAYPGAGKLLILADGGGSNGATSRAWKHYLRHELSDPYRLAVTVCHYPPGCSKWNPVEYRLFSQISNNWCGRPLSSLGVMLSLIRGTTTTKGLSVSAALDEGIYPKRRKFSWKDIDALDIESHEVCPEWNYTIFPRAAPQD